MKPSKTIFWLDKEGREKIPELNFSNASFVENFEDFKTKAGEDADATFVISPSKLHSDEKQRIADFIDTVNIKLYIFDNNNFRDFGLDFDEPLFLKSDSALVRAIVNKADEESED